MAQYKVLEYINCNGKGYPSGKIADIKGLSDEAAQQLISLGYIEAVKEKQPKKEA